MLTVEVRERIKAAVDSSTLAAALEAVERWRGAWLSVLVAPAPLPGDEQPNASVHRMVDEARARIARNVNDK